MQTQLEMIAEYRATSHHSQRYKLAVIRATFGKRATDLAREAFQIKTPGLRAAVQDMIASAIINADDTMSDGSLIEWLSDDIKNPWEYIFVNSLQTDGIEHEWRERAYRWFHTRKAM
jgi:hypothetical protein